MNKKKNKKSILILCLVVAAVIICVLAIIFIPKALKSSNNSTSEIYADSVASITGMGSLGSQNRFAGVVETQKSLDISADSEKKVKQIFVEVGQTVEVGTPLFEYDADEIGLKLEQARLELERIQNSIDNANSQITQLEKEKKSASKDEQLSYTTEILSLQTQIKESEYNLKTKQLEIDRLNESINSCVVTSTMSGMIKAINENGGYDQMGNPVAFMTILATGNYRIKGTVNEQNIMNLSPGTPVIIYSRANDSTWSGIVDSIDMENPTSSGNNFYGDSDSTIQSSNYPFYVLLDSSDGLMLGQHVYLEPDYGQNDIPDDGIWLMSSFIVQDGDVPYVWALDKNDKLEKRTVTLGEYNDGADCYEITDGLTPDDYIAFPSDSCKTGASVIKDTGMTIDDSIYARDDAIDPNGDINDGIDGEVYPDMGDGIDGEVYPDMGDGIDGEVYPDMGDGIDGADDMYNGTDGGMSDSNITGSEVLE